MMQKIIDEIEQRLEEKNKNVPSEVVKMVEKSILLQVLDQLWKEHIATLDLMRHTIVLRAYGQKDPLNEYKKEVFNNVLMTLYAYSPAKIYFIENALLMDAINENDNEKNNDN